MHLEGQSVVVFGAARGIGQAISTAFATEGCRVIPVDNRPPDLQQSIAMEAVTGCPMVLGDVTKLEDIQRIAESCGEVQHVVYSVGVGSGCAGLPFWNLKPSDWMRTLDVNLMGAVNVAHEFAPRLAARGQGTFLFLVSVAGQIGSPTDPPYSAAKAGLINFMQVAARDLAPYGVRVNALSPGMVKTELNHSVWQAIQNSLSTSEQQTYDVWSKEKISRIAPLGRWQSPAEYAAMAVFLASNHARNITGQTVNIDGGQVMHA